MNVLRLSDPLLPHEALGCKFLLTFISLPNTHDKYACSDISTSVTQLAYVLMTKTKKFHPYSDQYARILCLKTQTVYNPNGVPIFHFLEHVFLRRLK